MRSTATKLAAVTLTLLALVFGQPAHAHTGGAVIEVLDATSREGQVVEIRVAVTYSSDRERADAALLQAVGHGPNGQTTAPIDFTRRSGGLYRLRTTVPAAGVWRFDIASRFPPGSTSVTVNVGDGSRNDNAIWWFGIPVAAIVVASLLVLRLRRRHR